MLEHTTLLFFGTYLVVVILWRLSSHLSNLAIRKVVRYSLVYLSIPFIYLSPAFSIVTNVWVIILGNMTADYMSSGRATVVVVLLCIWVVIIFVAIMRTGKVRADQRNYSEGKNALEQLAAEGVDFASPAEIAFAIEAPDEASAVAIEKALIKQRYNSRIHFSPGEVENDKENTSNAVCGSAWMVYTKATMTARHEKIIRLKADLVRIAKPYGGKYKGLKKVPMA
jgi:hypothetical protein